MALCKSGSFIVKSVKPVLRSSCFIIPNPVNFQVRYAARKGYRELAKKKKKAAAVASTPVVKDISRIKNKFVNLEKTVDLKKPEPPNDDVIAFNNFNYKKFSLAEAIKMHSEYHHPTVYNNPGAPVSVRVEVSMIGKSQNSFIKPFSSIAAIPHPFLIGLKKEVLVLCKHEDIDLALSCGASVAGASEVIKKIQEGTIQPSFYNYVIAHTNMLGEITPLRNIFKNQFPRASKGTLTNNLESAIFKFLHGIEFTCTRLNTTSDVGFVLCNIGKIDMDPEHLEENFKALLQEILKFKPNNNRDFITWTWCSSPPSKEEFSIDLSKYLNQNVETDTYDDDDDDEDNTSLEKTEKMQQKALLKEYAEEQVFGQRS